MYDPNQLWMNDYIFHVMSLKLTNILSFIMWTTGIWQNDLSTNYFHGNHALLTWLLEKKCVSNVVLISPNLNLVLVFFYHLFHTLHLKTLYRESLILLKSCRISISDLLCGDPILLIFSDFILTYIWAVYIAIYRELFVIFACAYFYGLMQKRHNAVVTH